MRQRTSSVARSLAMRLALRALWVCAACTLSANAIAQSSQSGPLPGENERALPGLLRLSLPTQAASVPVAAVGLGYAWMDEVSADDNGHRFRGTLAAAIPLLPSLALSVDVRGHVDRFPSAPGGAETNGYGEPRLTLRYSAQAGPRTTLGAEVDARFVGAEAPSVALGATSPSLRGLFATRLTDATWFGAQLGFHFDRSSEAVPHAERLSFTDRRTLGASSWNALQWGLGGSYFLSQAGTELIGEVSGEWWLGSDAPPVLQSPWALGVGARHPLNPATSVLLTAEVGLSERPGELAAAELLPLQPRLGVGVALLWQIGVRAPEPVLPVKAEPREVQPAPVVKAEPEVVEPKTDPVTGTVVDEGGRPLPDVEVTLTIPGAEPQQSRTFADGSFNFDSVPEETVTLRVTTPGFDEQSITIAAGEEREREVVLRPAVPAGQIRGRVLNLKGAPILAKVSISPGDHVAPVDDDGSFALELPPGRYTVKFEHEDFATQWRKIEVQDRGVFILNIALTR